MSDYEVPPRFGGCERLSERQQRLEIVERPRDDEDRGLSLRPLCTRHWRGRHVEGGIVSENCTLEVLQLVPGFEPQLLVEQAAAVVVCRERLGLASRAIESDHQLATKTLAERMFRNEGLELADDVGMSARHEISFDPAVETRKPYLAETRDLGLREALIRELRKGRSSPQPERLVEPALARESLETLEIELALLDPEDVTRLACLDPVATERLAQARDVDLQRLLGPLRGRVLPQRVEQSIRRDDLVGVKEEHGEERALLGTAEVERLPVLDNFEGTKDSELHEAADASTGCNEAQRRLGGALPRTSRRFAASMSSGRDDRTRRSRTTGGSS
jgi:hypothetical protein